jgi:Copper transport outer membrane protein, MctB
MLDFRYHALSLAAVLIALVVGLLLGAAIGDNNLYTKAERDKQATIVAERNQAQASNAQLNSELSLRERYESAVYSTVVADELVGERIGLIFLGQDNDQIDGLVREAIAPSGAQVEYDAVVGEPLALDALATAAVTVPSAARYAALATDPTQLPHFEKRIATELVNGGPAPSLLHAVEPSLFSSYSGVLGSVGAIVIVRDDGSIPKGAVAQTASFETGLVSDLAADGVPVVGVELTDTTPSQIGWYQQERLASVDDLDDISGRTALVYALAGAHGNYGIKSSAQALLPSTLPTTGK